MMIDLKKRISVKLNLLLFPELWINYKIPKQLEHEIREVKFCDCGCTRDESTQIANLCTGAIFEFCI